MHPRETDTNQQPQRPDPEHGKSATTLGFFGVLVEIFGVVLMLGIGLSFLMVEMQPNAVAWVAFVIGAVLLVDAIRRLRRLATGKDRY